MSQLHEAACAFSGDDAPSCESPPDTFQSLRSNPTSSAVTSVYGFQLLAFFRNHTRCPPRVRNAHQGGRPPTALNSWVHALASFDLLTRIPATVGLTLDDLFGQMNQQPFCPLLTQFVKRPQQPQFEQRGERFDG